MGRDKKNEKRVGKFAMLLQMEVMLEAWKRLSPSAQVAYLHLIFRCWSEGKKLHHNNNGEVALSARKLADVMGIAPKTAMSAMADLQAKGWIICTKRHQKGVEGRALAPEWRLTMRPTGLGKTHRPPTREPERWREGHDYEVTEYATSKRPGHARGDASRFQQAPTPVNVIALRAR
ncbi:hypothetical protein [Ruegeria atlantica]|uniref:hypothetical protein n=1 Tax=Ruegeria atlantica TaxID=81569 RepID=UPI002495755A|nr:hypothetical protein [Ruegeria atlantica]